MVTGPTRIGAGSAIAATIGALPPNNKQKPKTALRILFIGALSSKSSCAHTRAVTYTFQPFRHLHDCSGCFRLERFAGWGSHPLESAAFARRT
jgi:hypothetical protein